MKAMAILFRILFSILVLLSLALYLQLSPTVSLGQFCDALTPAALSALLGEINTTTVTLGIILLLGIFPRTRILEAAWNVLFCASILLLLAGGLYSAFGPSIALPNAIYYNDAVNQFCQALPTYPVAIAIICLIFVAGWLCASACVRVAITAVISYGLWYAITEFFSYIVYLWANSAEPTMPEALNMIQSTPWVIAAVPAAFFLIYALLMAFFETFITHGAPRKPSATAQQKADAAPEAEDKPAEEQKADAAPEAEDKPAEEQKADAAPEAEDKPAEEQKADAAPEAEDKPAEEQKADAAPEAEDKPAEEQKAEPAPENA